MGDFVNVSDQDRVVVAKTLKTIAVTMIIVKTLIMVTLFVVINARKASALDQGDLNQCNKRNFVGF